MGGLAVEAADSVGAVDSVGAACKPPVQNHQNPPPRIELLHGDCLGILPTLPANSVDLILVDPPYFRVKDEAWDRQWESSDGFLQWLDKVLAEYFRVLKPNGSLYVFASAKLAAKVEVLIGGRFNVLNRITWAKPFDQGRWKSACKEDLRRFFEQKEEIIFAEHANSDNYAKGEAGYSLKCDQLRGFVFAPLRDYLRGEMLRAGSSTKELGEYLGVTGRMIGHYVGTSQWELPTQANYLKMRECLNAKGGEYLRREYEDLRREYEDLRREYEDLRRPFAVTKDVPYTDVWEFPTVASYPGKHPCEKPLEMLRHMIATSTKPDAVVLDSFMGTGSTGIAARSLGRAFIGIERDAWYFALATARIEHAHKWPMMPRFFCGDDVGDSVESDVGADREPPLQGNALARRIRPVQAALL